MSLDGGDKLKLMFDDLDLDVLEYLLEEYCTEIKKETERKDDAKVPFFGSIPLIGFLFRQESKFKDKTELLIFLTPTLVSGQKPQ